jgi:hypothetical protein
MYATDLQCDIGTGDIMPATTVLYVQGFAPNAVSTGVWGRLDFLTLSGGEFIGDVVGQIDCMTGRFHADLENTMYSFQPVPLVPFTGTLDGVALNGRFSGVWSYGVQDGPMCVGTWMGDLRQ